MLFVRVFIDLGVQLAETALISVKGMIANLPLVAFREVADQSGDTLEFYIDAYLGSPR